MAPGRSLTCGLALVLAVAGAAFLGRGAWIYAKAELAQLLIEHAWQRALAGEPAPKPWPWADTWPVGRLEAPLHGVALFVLAGSSGRTLAFGPGHEQGTALPGTPGNSVVGGHRDTHLAFLQAVRRGESIWIERADGARVEYRVAQLDVLDRRDTWVARNDGETRLTLVTCWPFDALRPGGSERYVVIAEPVGSIPPWPRPSRSEASASSGPPI